MLIKCPECDLNVSDQAPVCPHCGYPLKTFDQKSTRGKFRKRMRLPNGFGQISEIKGQNLRNRFRASVTVGKRDDGRPICKLLKPKAYFKTYNEAYEALVEYNKSPFDLNDSMTMDELFKKWYDQHITHLKNPDSARAIKSAWDYCSQIYLLPVRAIRPRHIHTCVEDGVAERYGKIVTPSPDVKIRIKTVLNMMMDYAVEHELTDKNYSRIAKIKGDEEKRRGREIPAHTSFTDEEMEILWKYKDLYIVKVILYQCYSGWRPGELCELELTNIILDKRLVIGGKKTAAGINRVVPIHERVYEIVKSLYEESVKHNGKYLIRFSSYSDTTPTYIKYKEEFYKTLKTIGIYSPHKPHDCRKHFVTQCKKYNVDEYAIKRLVGHTINDITEKIYTDRSVEWLASELQKVV